VQIVPRLSRVLSRSRHSFKERDFSVVCPCAIKSVIYPTALQELLRKFEAIVASIARNCWCWLESPRTERSSSKVRVEMNGGQSARLLIFLFNLRVSA
jgi:hypothetical protein